MDYSKIALTTFIFFIANIVIWFQLNSQLVWQWAKGPKALLICCLMGIPISFMFWYTTKIGYEGFDENLWPVRFVGFAMSMLTFPILTYLYLGEAITLVTGISIILSIVIILLQLL